MKLKQVKPKKLLKALVKAGCTIKRQKGSHVFLECISPDGKTVTSISLHNEPLPKGTLHGIIKQSGFDEDVIKDLL